MPPSKPTRYADERFDVQRRRAVGGAVYREKDIQVSDKYRQCRSWSRPLLLLLPPRRLLQGQAEEREREFTRGLAEVAASFSTGIWYRRRMERALERAIRHFLVNTFPVGLGNIG